MGYKPYEKVVTRSCYGVCAIYEPHPFRPSVIREAIRQSKGKDIKIVYADNIDVKDDEWCWVFYDWCGNPVGLSDEKPEGEVVERFTKENLGDENLAEYLNKEPYLVAL